ncbi:MAG: signal peptidase II [Solobacterium sp.]|nr:signal peptidase II [Solobacterium sp.]
MELGIIGIVILLDQISKYIVQQNAAAIGQMEIIPNFLYLRYIKNTGAAWSMLSNHTMLLTLISVVEIGILVYFLLDVRKKKQTLYRIALSLMIGGAIGNLIDRVSFQYVRDFIDTYIFGYDFPVFNIADSALCIGAFLLIVILLFEKKESEA